MSEAADPEDVDAILRQYHAAARKAIESHGGTVEKFIGDAVVGVFGVPAVHEDDPERAVRAALRLVDAVEGMTRPDGTPLQVRVGVNTGEALARLDVQTDSGHGFLAGDAVNTAARLQAAAPPMGALVGRTTHELTDGIFECRELPPVRLKGKAELVQAWQVLAPVARRNVEAPASDASPFVGREGELAYLRALFDAAVSSRTPRFALILGEPGIGKTRLVQELLALVDDRPEMTVWRQGRCLPYGEGVSFWALAEIVRAHCGIGDGAEESVTCERLEAAVPAGADREWLVDRLRALLGFEAPAASREENFAAWLRFLETAVAARPAVLVFEDLHWADEALLDFLDYLATRLADAPLTVIATSRPEAFESRGPFAAAAGHVDRVVLKRLSVLETRALIDRLAVDSPTVESALADIVDRCGGNPLYAEQCVRLLADGVQGDKLPGSVQAVIAARLDALPQREKSVAGDAAVVGTTFWDGALAALGGRGLEETDELIRGLVAHQLVRRARDSSLPEEREYAFAHALTQEVAYRQLPRAVRARKHAAVASWLQTKAAGRLEDLAEVLAHHYATAHDVAVTAGEESLAAAVREPAARFLDLAGDRAARVDVAAAAKRYAAALELAREGSALEAQLEFKLGESQLWAGSTLEAAQHLERAVDLLSKVGEMRRAAVAMVRLARARSHLFAETDEVERLLLRGAVELLEGVGPSEELVIVLTEWGRDRINAGMIDEGAGALERAIDVACKLGIPEPALALSILAGHRAKAGDPRWADDSRRSLALAEEQGLGVERARVWLNYAASIALAEGPRRSLEEYDRAFSFADSRGLTEAMLFGRCNRIDALVHAGEWDDALSEVDHLERHFVQACGHAGEVAWIRLVALLPLMWRGRDDDAFRLMGPLIDEVRTSGLPEDVVLAGVVGAVVTSAKDRAEACGLLEAALSEFASGHGASEWGYDWLYELLPEAARIALSASERGLAQRLRDHTPWSLAGYRLADMHVDALLAEAAGEHESAAAGLADAGRGWHDFGVPYEEGHALLGQGRCLVALGRVPDAAQPLQQAQKIFTRLGATPAFAEADRLLSEIAPPPG